MQQKPLDRVAKPLDRVRMWAIAQGLVSPDGKDIHLVAIENALAQIDSALDNQGEPRTAMIDAKKIIDARTWLRTGLPADHPDHVSVETAQRTTR